MMTASPIRSLAQSVLVVDDHDYTREMICKFLDKLGCRGEQAGSGQDALAKIQDTAFDLILLDVYMDDCDGFSLLHKIKSQGELGPFVMMSAAGQDADVLLARELGAISFLHKPFDFFVLKNVLEGIPLSSTRVTWQLSAS